MDRDKVAEFSANYETLGEWELFDINSRRATLTEEARIALDQTISKRGIDLAKLKEVEAAELTQQAEYEQQQQLKAEKRDARYFKFFLIIGLPIIILGALFRTDQVLETLVSSLVQVGVIGVLYWGYLKFKRSRNQRRP
jgi:uncharacterized membrane protein